MSIAAARPQVQVQRGDGKAAKEQISLPGVFLAPIRPDVVQFVHTNMAKNSRQPYAVARNAGMQSSAESWGTGRAVARIPRVPGGGTHRSGQAAFGNMCRGGRMFAPTKIWRRWHRKINQNQKRFAVCSALAASALPALVMARGHRIEKVPEVPLVVANESIASISKTKDAIALLAKVGAFDDAEHARDSRQIRSGQGKIRNRRYVQRRGPLVVYNALTPMVRAFRNISGVELCQVDRLNLLQLAPGGHVGRFIVWVRDAFERLDALFGSTTSRAQLKTNYRVPRSIMANSDLARVIGSNEVQSALRPAKPWRAAFRPRKRNPLVNLGSMVKLNPAAIAHKRRELKLQTAAGRKAATDKRKKLAKVEGKRKHKTGAYVKLLTADKAVVAK